jgi:amicyanin
MTIRLDGPRLLLAAAAAALLVASVAIAPARGATHAVAIAEFAFSPATLTITAGDTVTWTNEDAIAHTATSINGGFDSGDLEQGESYAVTFTTPGTYDYLCTPHPSMTGRIVVVASSAPAATPAPSGGLPNVAQRPGDAGASLRLLGAALLALAAIAWPALRAIGRGAVIPPADRAAAARSSRRSRPDG